MTYKIKEKNMKTGEIETYEVSADRFEETGKSVVFYDGDEKVAVIASHVITSCIKIS